MDQKHTSDSLKFTVNVPNPYVEYDRYVEYINTFTRLFHAPGTSDVRKLRHQGDVELLFNSEQDRTFFLLNVS